ncbi:hypothetical protein [Bifidobacterium parmae]|uniref:Uncharacterized protein n=1 Tax=Bifidobacterium parmae TaxID=361854 RepID=A0A2N5IVH7_9BIFI|nr:hypothetical protein [Bifidobacterium parmae]PLS25965.1 hypothetical protein Uis4E_2223 [Bifidobacterium parmae]
MEPLATLEDLDAYKVDYSAVGADMAGRLLSSVSAAIRDAAGGPISRCDVTVTIPSEASRKLDLPCRPVNRVTHVLVDGEETDDWTLLGSSLYRDVMWGPPNGIPLPVTVTMSIGQDPVPEDIVRLACSMVAAGLHQQAEGGPGANVGKAYERVDDFQIGYQQGTATVIDATELPEATKRSLRARFGIRGISVGVFK